MLRVGSVDGPETHMEVGRTNKLNLMLENMVYTVGSTLRPLGLKSLRLTIYPMQ